MEAPHRNATGLTTTRNLGVIAFVKAVFHYHKTVKSPWIILRLLSEKPENILDLVNRFTAAVGYAPGDIVPRMDVLITTVPMTAIGWLTLFDENQPQTVESAWNQVSRRKDIRDRIYRVTDRGRAVLKAYYDE